MHPNGTVALLGSPNVNSNGVVYYFTLSSNVWSGVVQTNSPYVFKSTNPNTNYYFGASIAYSVNSATGLQRCLIGEPRTAASLAGHVYSFDLSNSGYWGLTTVSGSNNAIADQDITDSTVQSNTINSFGAAVAMDASGITAAIGAPGYSSGSGHVYIYKNYAVKS
jgi:hypothetical protein